ncbi:MAG: hypothetical protein KIS76_11985 [Pyrinomonadaceae bacterium]|nr:hypothetical protein [Pyrinomonadaceae bacterium]
MSFLEKAERELAAGNLWRAKEILQGSIPSAGYNIELFEKLGNVLLQMGDLPEAGKFLFLSGVRKPEYEEAIGIFLRKYGRKPPNLFQTFPHTAGLSKISDYPEIVAAKLRELNFPETLKTESGEVAVPPENDKYFLAGCLIAILVIVGLAILGVVKLYEIVFR